MIPDAQTHILESIIRKNKTKYPHCCLILEEIVDALRTDNIIGLERFIRTERKTCAKCGAFGKYPLTRIEGHHIIPVHRKGTDADGIINLCQRHHTGRPQGIQQHADTLPLNEIREYTLRWLKDEHS